MALVRECFDGSFGEVAFSSLCPMNQARVRCPYFFGDEFFDKIDDFSRMVIGSSDLTFAALSA